MQEADLKGKTFNTALSKAKKKSFNMAIEQRGQKFKKKEESSSIKRIESNRQGRIKISY